MGLFSIQPGIRVLQFRPLLGCETGDLAPRGGGSRNLVLKATAPDAFEV